MLVGLVSYLLGALACSGPAPQQAQTGRVLRPPPKPGESITHTMMCRCQACEPTSCCRELDQEQPADDCADGTDFSKCGMQISSCESRCFEHTWRVRVEVGCDAQRPPECCH
jgi:hypothetical protein